MNPFELLGDEELYQMSENWDTETLINMAKAYKRVNIIANGIIEKRKLRERKIKDFKDAILDRQIVYQKFNKLGDNKGATVSIVTDLKPWAGISVDEIEIGQFGSGMSVTGFSWILTCSYHLVNCFDGQVRRVRIKRDSPLITELAKNLIDQGYEKGEKETLLP